MGPLRGPWSSKVGCPVIYALNFTEDAKCVRVFAPRTPLIFICQ